MTAQVFPRACQCRLDRTGEPVGGSGFGARLPHAGPARLIVSTWRFSLTRLPDFAAATVLMLELLVSSPESRSK